MIILLVSEWAAVVERGVQSGAVVGAFDEVNDCRSRGLMCWPGVAMQELFFEGGEKALGHSVIPAGSWVAQTQAGAMCSEHVTVCGSGVLTGFKGSSQHCRQELRCNSTNVGARIAHFAPECSPPVFFRRLMLKNA